MIFKNKIAELLIARNLKQADLCRLAGVATSSMANYLSGKSSPTLETAIQIADALDVTLDDLVGRSEGVILNADEIALLEKYRELDDSKKQNVSDFIDFEYNKKFVSKTLYERTG